MTRFCCATNPKMRETVKAKSRDKSIKKASPQRRTHQSMSKDFLINSVERAI